MAKAILAQKLGMTQIFQGDIVVPVTVMKAGPCVVTQLKVSDRDGYEAVQVGFGDVKADKVNKPVTGHYEKSHVVPRRHLAELPLPPADYMTGQQIKADIFAEGDHADVTGVSKGKGFAGVIKRHGFAGGPAAHGSRFHRAPGAIGQCATPSRVFKGKKLPGRMGHEQVTAQNLLVVSVDPEQDLIMLRGSVPGPKGSLVMIKESVKVRKGRASR
jgi:large subunit ribosomal protein L3